MPIAYVGIDLGTTFSGVVVSSGGNSQTVRDPVTGLAKFPSAVYYPRGPQSPLVGAAAISEAILEGRVQFLLQQFKRDMGSARQFNCGESIVHTAEQLSSVVLEHCRKLALERLPSAGPGEIRWTVSVPAKFGEPQKAATLRAALRAGIPQDQLTLVLEPEAAAITAYLNRRIALQDKQHLLLFDFGGGTLDIVLMEKLPGGLDPVVIDGGDAKLGGIDLDLALARYVLSKVSATAGSKASRPLDDWAPADKFNLMRDIETAKRSLCGTRGLGGVKRHRLLVPLESEVLDVELSVSDFSEAAAPFIDAARSALQKTLDLAWQRRGISPKDISWVLLTGGTSQILGLEEMIRRVCGEQARIAMPDDPWESIAKGACIFAEDPRVILSKISGDSYGVRIVRDARPGDPPHRLFTTSYGERKCRANSLFFLRGHKVPQEGIVHNYFSVEDNQTVVTFRVLRGDDDDPDKCQNIGELTLQIPLSPHGYPVNCRFLIDEGNRLQVIAWDPTREEKVHCHVDWAPAPLVGPNG